MKVLIGGFKAKEGKELKTPIYMQAWLMERKKTQTWIEDKVKHQKPNGKILYKQIQGGRKCKIKAKSKLLLYIQVSVMVSKNIFSFA